MKKVVLFAYVMTMGGLAVGFCLGMIFSEYRSRQRGESEGMRPIEKHAGGFH